MLQVYTFNSETMYVTHFKLISWHFNVDIWDYIQLMAYDLNGAWANYTGINAPLFPRDDEVGDQIYLNVVSEKLRTILVCLCRGHLSEAIDLNVLFKIQF